MQTYRKVRRCQDCGRLCHHQVPPENKFFFELARQRTHKLREEFRREVSTHSVSEQRWRKTHDSSYQIRNLPNYQLSWSCLFRFQLNTRSTTQSTEFQRNNKAHGTLEIISSPYLSFITQTFWNLTFLSASHKNGSFHCKHRIIFGVTSHSFRQKAEKRSQVIAIVPRNSCSTIRILSHSVPLVKGVYIFVHFFPCDAFKKNVPSWRWS